jgi:hypothetical protein
VAAYAASKIDPEKLLERYFEASRYDLNPDKMMQNFIFLVEELFEKQMVTNTFLEKARSYTYE